MMKYSAWFDGSAKPNPGEMTIGGYIEDENGKTIFEFSEEVGVGTNNQAEYLSFIKLVKGIKEIGLNDIIIQGDSALVVNQVNKKWKAKNAHIKSLRNTALKLLKGIDWNLSHVSRTQNKRADLLTR